MTESHTIFALSSGAGRAGVAVIRVSGPGSRAAVLALAGREPEPRRAALRKIRHPETGGLLDEGMVIVFPGPRSATGEDVAEFHIHGGPAVVMAILDALRSLPELRPAEAGEFSLRAFRNGRIDLVQAEGLADLLSAETERQRSQAVSQIDGRASRVFDGWRQQLLELLARIEAAVDFVDEDDVAKAALGDVQPRAVRLAQNMAAEVARAGHGERLRNGVRVVLLGLPNTGKSSLLNALSRRDVAIVSEIAGTTRDVIEVHLDLGGVPVILSDTAGLRDVTVDRIEQMGMARAQAAAQQADIVLWVAAPDVAGSGAVAAGVTADLLIWNKADLGEAPAAFIACSTRKAGGEDAVLQHLTAQAEACCGSGEGALVVRQRQVAAVEESIRWLNESIRHRTDQLELVAEDLRRAARALARVTGAIDVEDLLDSIFSRFCIGK